MSKYPIKKEFFPYNHFKPPIGKRFLKIAVPFMRVPGLIYKSKAVCTVRYEVESYDGERIECFMMSPRGKEGSLPCLIYIHGGGFVLPAAKYHYQNALRYAEEVGCRVWFVNYRLAPTHPFPAFYEDCYAAACYLHGNADRLGVDVGRIAIGGDSAGATLSVGVCMMARDRSHPIRFRYQALFYPFLDMRGTSPSNKKFTDTPMWNSSLSAKVSDITSVSRENPDYVYYSPVEAECFDGLPPAYIEPAEFDCLHDDGLLYAEKLRQAGIAVTLNQTEGTVHGFDIKQGAPTTVKALKDRIEFMKKHC